jgi:glycerol-3-phosphate dehydrogenase (NAD(P)+)
MDNQKGQLIKNERKETVLIIGAGEIGRAIEKILSDKQNLKIELWDKDASKVPGQKQLVDIVPLADFLFLCVPSWASRAVLHSVLPNLNKNTLIISLAKGIEARTLKTMDSVLEELLPSAAFYALLMGPMLAEELMQGLVGIGVVASKESRVFDKTRALFADTNLLIEFSTDVRGIAFAGVLKNIYAIGLGIADGLNLGNNFKAWLVKTSVKEMAEIIELAGGQKESAFGSAGLGDLIATGFSPYSRNRQVGDELVRTGKCCLKSEGFVSLPSVIKLIKEDKISQLPILQALTEIIIYHKNVKTTFERLATKSK